MTRRSLNEVTTDSLVSAREIGVSFGVDVFAFTELPVSDFNGVCSFQ
jgi:hypothetical protein